MRFGQLMPGEKYLITGGLIATYEGKHDEVLTLADGAVYDGSRGMLRFRVAYDDGDQIVFLDSGADVKESIEARDARLAQEADVKARKERAFAEATSFLEGVGLTLTENSWSTRGKPGTAYIRAGELEADDIDVDGLTVGKLRALLAR